MIITPFGRPVVPDVYISRWTSSPSTCARGRRAPTSAREIGEPLPPGDVLGRDADADEVALESVGRFVREVDERVVAHERARFGVLEDEPQLRRREPPVDRHRDRTEVVGGEDRRQELDAVVREQPDDVAGADAARVRARPPARRPNRSHLL